MANIEIKRGYEVLPDNNIRFGIRITNVSELAIFEVEVILDFTESLFKLPLTIKLTSLRSPNAGVHQPHSRSAKRLNNHIYERPFKSATSNIYLNS